MHTKSHGGHASHGSHGLHHALGGWRLLPWLAILLLFH